MLISFVITYHNEPVRLVRECIASLLRLPLQANEREIIVVDDGSDAAFVAQQDDIIVLRQPNQGLSAARNAGIEAARGEYVQFVDADDELFVEQYSQIISRLREGSYDLVLFDFTHENRPKLLHCQKDFESGASYMIQCNLHASACCYAFRKSALGESRFLPGIYHEDELFTPLLMLRVGRLSWTDIQAYHYRRHEGSIITTTDDEHVKRRFDDFEKVLLTLQREVKQRDGIQREALQRRVNQLVMDHVYNVWSHTHRYKSLKWRCDRLHQKHLLPLPIRCYTLKYWLFSIGTRIICL